MVKLFEDTMVKNGLVPDDSKRFCRGITLTPDDTMAKKTYKITVEVLE